MKIGILGPMDSIERILGCAQQEETGAELIPLEAYGLQESDTIWHARKGEVDGVLCTGPSVFDHLKTEGSQLPVLFVPHNEDELFQQMATHELRGYSCVSIDLLEQEVVDRCLSELQIQGRSLPHKHGRSQEEYLEFHVQNVKRNKNTLVLTTFTPIFEFFKKQGIPVYRMYQAETTIKSKLRELEMMVRAYKLDCSKIAVQLICLGEEDERMTQASALEKRLSLEQRLLPYIHSVEGAFFSYGRNEYIIFSTKGLLTRHEALTRFCQILTTSPYPIFSGIGIGETASLAEINANRAIAHSVHKKEPALFVMGENNNLSGPVTPFGAAAFSVNGHKWEEEVADRAKLGLSTIKRLRSLMDMTQKDTFTAEELAQILNLSKRSARRILKQLTDAGYAVLLTKEISPGAGRPQNVVRIRLDEKTRGS